LDAVVGGVAAHAEPITRSLLRILCVITNFAIPLDINLVGWWYRYTGKFVTAKIKLSTIEFKSERLEANLGGCDGNPVLYSDLNIFPDQPDRDVNLYPGIISYQSGEDPNDVK
jgi:hypothetical protein